MHTHRHRDKYKCFCGTHWWGSEKTTTDLENTLANHIFGKRHFLNLVNNFYLQFCILDAEEATDLKKSNTWPPSSPVPGLPLSYLGAEFPLQPSLLTSLQEILCLVSHWLPITWFLKYSDTRPFTLIASSRNCIWIQWVYPSESVHSISDFNYTLYLLLNSAPFLEPGGLTSFSSYWRWIQRRHRRVARTSQAMTGGTHTPWTTK